MEASNKISILCVDDEEPNLFLFKVIFEKNYRVLTASSGVEGLEVLSTDGDNIIAVFSDMRMPIMSGLEFIKKARDKYDHIGFFILSAYNSNDEVQEAVAQKLIRRFFTKPFNTEQIEDCIEKLKNENKVSM